jgi:hypothetical protein
MSQGISCEAREEAVECLPPIGDDEPHVFDDTGIDMLGICDEAGQPTEPGSQSCTIVISAGGWLLIAADSVLLPMLSSDRRGT